jgi:hypothetical protein
LVPSGQPSSSHKGSPGSIVVDVVVSFSVVVVTVASLDSLLSSVAKVVVVVYFVSISSSPTYSDEVEVVVSITFVTSALLEGNMKLRKTIAKIPNVIGTNNLVLLKDLEPRILLIKIK